jgi:serine/threonine-protein kinase
MNSLLRHLEDACPSIIYDAQEDSQPPARYLIGKELGAGSIGQVIEAWDNHLERQVAIKILHEGEGISREAIVRFLAEAQITAQLEHPAVIPVHEIGLMPGGMPYFSMKLVKGRSLSDIINHLRIGDREVTRQYNQLARLRLFQRIAQGMAYAHAKGVVHRDLKPDNILIGQYGEVQIMDWGLAKTVSGGGDTLNPASVRVGLRMNSYSGGIAGTPAYMSPEQAKGNFKAIGPNSDVFALGLMLAELMTLLRIYREPTFTATLEAAKNPPGPVNINRLTPRKTFILGVDRVVEKATHPDPLLRFPNASEMSDAIAKVIEAQLSISGSFKPLTLGSERRLHPGREEEVDFTTCWRHPFFWLGVLAALLATIVVKLLS